jgi:hypothetical protein
VAGCNSIPVQSRQNIGVATYPPTDPATVQILRQPPTEPNIKLGEITAQPQSTSTPVADIETKLRDAGAKMGANAVVIVEDRTGVTGATYAGGWGGWGWGGAGEVEPNIGVLIRAVPIRYTNTNAPAATGGSQMP